MNFVIFSPPGGGKSYINKLISEKYDMVVFDCDSYLDDIFTKEVRNIIDNEDKYLKIKLSVIKNKIDKVNLGNTILDLGGGTVFQDDDFVSYIKGKKLKIVYLNARFDVIRDRFLKNRDEITKRRFLTNGNINDWEHKLLRYYTNYSRLKKYSDCVIEYDYDNLDKTLNKIFKCVDN